MSTDTPSGESNASLSVRDAAALFAGEPIEQEQQQPAQAEPAKVEPEKVPEATQAEADPEVVEAEAAETDEKVTIEVDGKTVELSKAELADYYKNGLRQADYTKKTMEAAEQRKAAEAETAKARAEREQYAHGLQQANAVLAAQLQERTTEQWNELARTDPAQWVLERNLYEQRHAAFMHNQAQLQQLEQRSKAEAEQAQRAYLSQQQEALLAKLPEWKDESKAKADQAQIAKYLQEQGFESDLIQSIQDHRMVLVARDAMRYRDMVAKAQAAAKQVKTLPGKVERPGGGETNPLDGRTSAMKQLAKSGSVKDAAAVLSLLK